MRSKIPIVLISLFLSTNLIARSQQYYCTAADSRFFDLLLNLIGSIHKSNFDDLEEIAVYDLGLTKQQQKYLSKVEKVSLHQVERTNEQILEPILTAPSGRKVKGNFSWKPVVLKQSLELFPYVLYLDAGLCVMDDLSDIFSYIQSEGYFFVSAGLHNIADRITNYVITNLIDKNYGQFKEKLLAENTWEMAAGFQGVSRKMLEKYVMPMYELSRDIKLFHDDGSAKLGWGAGRHDQILFSILIHAGLYELFDQGMIKLKFPDGSTKDVCCHSTFDPQVMHVWISQAGRNYNGGFSRYIIFKRK